MSQASRIIRAGLRRCRLAADGFRIGLSGRTPAVAGSGAGKYETLYELHARSAADAVGAGPYDLIGQIELDLLVAEGLRPNHRLVDFGCGAGRLALHAIPYLEHGCYVGIDISQTFLHQAEAATRGLLRDGRCDVRWVHQDDINFSLDPGTVDVFCAFSVFTHMEHEDLLRYLVAIRPLLAPAGTVVLTCLPIHLENARRTFLESAEVTHEQRWNRVRNVVTSVEMMESVAELAGFAIVHWWPGDAPVIPSASGVRPPLGQSALTLTARS